MHGPRPDAADLLGRAGRLGELSVHWEELAVGRPDIVCFSHLRWDFVFQRPNHLMSRAARDRRVFFVEEPVFLPPEADADGAREIGTGTRAAIPGLETHVREGVVVVTPHLPAGLDARRAERVLRRLIDDFLATQRVEGPVLWYYTPMALPWTRHLTSAGVVYDCMDQLSAFNEAPPDLMTLETELLSRADVVFTGGHRLYQAKRGANPNVHAFPSAVDVAHFAQARARQSDPDDQAGLGRPRLGFFGVLDERIDFDLLRGVAEMRPGWQIVLVGPTVKIRPEEMPRAANLHYLGGRGYDELPRYLAGWDVAIMPFARNAATEYISPTKTPEYLAGGRAVVSTSIHDVVASYGKAGLVRIADEPAEFVRAVEAALAEDTQARWPEIDAYIAEISWDRTWAAMARLVDAATRGAPAAAAASRPVSPLAPARRSQKVPAAPAALSGVSAGAGGAAGTATLSRAQPTPVSRAGARLDHGSVE
jgi:UDP-galactopyranose mutase